MTSATGIRNNRSGYGSTTTSLLQPANADCVSGAFENNDNVNLSYI